MGRIRVLSAELAGRIAAGEVIERPASVIKELVENAIDAGATRIRVLTEQGGQKLMQVIDDGCGMDRADALLCLEAHATSKISQEGDVGQIRTLGFRGEALPSISAVSRFELQTRPADQEAGTEVLVDNGVIRDVRDCGCAPGTSIRVQWLFGNLPARRKFLKGPATEDDFIQEMLLMLSLTRPAISFELLQNGRCVLRAPATAHIAGRVEMLVGKDAFAAMIPVDHTEDGMHIYGFISRPGFTRSSRRDQRIIVNGRAASAETVFFAIREAYDTLVLKGRYPGVVLYVDIAPERVDVNVHPTKREVRFREPMRVSQAVASALREALRGIVISQGTSAQPSALGGMPSALPDGAAAAPTPVLVDTTPERPATPALPSAPLFAPIQEILPFHQDEALPSENAPEAVPVLGAADPWTQTPAQNAVPAPSGTTSSSSAAVQCRLLGTLGKEYLLAEGTSGLVVVNIRAARQRILFERLLANLRNQSAPRQALLMPVTLHLAPDEARLLTRELPFFQSIGYTVEEFGANAFLVTAVPQSLPDRDLSDTIHDILADLRQDSVTNRQSAVHLAQLASRHAVCGTQPLLPPEERQGLLDALLRCEMPYADPAGLPTMVHVTYSELKQRFRN